MQYPFGDTAPCRYPSSRWKARPDVRFSTNGEALGQCLRPTHSFHSPRRSRCPPVRPPELTAAYVSDLSRSHELAHTGSEGAKPMLKMLILGGTAIATVAAPVAADAQYYAYNYGYSYQHHHHRNKAGAAI